MCTHMRQIWNPYSRKLVLVKCGKCEACQQEKAMARANRIRNNVTTGTIALFVTLTYTNDFVPYVKLEDIRDCKVDLPVFRQCQGQFVFDRHSRVKRFKKIHKESVIANVDASQIEDKSFQFYTHLKGMPRNCIGVTWFPDVQDFYKRLRINLSRHYNYEKPFSFFACTEYGGHTYRPHSHHLLFIPREDEELFRSAIIEAWPYADKSRTAKFIEVARDAANYVASYVNSSANVLPLMQSDNFKQKHSASKNFGVVLDCFQLPQILQKIDSGHLFYHREQKFDGESCVLNVPFPKYVLYRYFPVCKGFSWLDSSQLHSILLDPQKVGTILNDTDTIQNKLVNPIYHYSPLESYRIYVRLENCFKRFHAETGLSRYDYAYYYERCWSLYASTLEKLLHETFQEQQLDYADFYENGFEIVDKPDIAPTMSNLLNKITLDPNERKDIKLKTMQMHSLYSRMNKQRKVTNYVMDCMSYDV